VWLLYVHGGPHFQDVLGEEEKRRKKRDGQTYREEKDKPFSVDSHIISHAVNMAIDCF
jgi:hypothetical protein